jgi:hypothetical protein
MRGTPSPRITRSASWSKSNSNEGHFILETERIWRPYLASRCSGVAQASQVALTPHAPQPVQVWSKSGSNEGHFTLQNKTLLVLSQRCDSNITCCTMYQAVQISSSWGRNEGHITLHDERAFRLYVASHCSGVKQISHMAVSHHSPEPVHIWSKSGSNEGHITTETEKPFVPPSPRIAVG